MIETPFGPPVHEVALARAPLVFVVAQARFERIASVSSEAFISGFQEAIRATYPVMRREQQATVLVGPDGRVVTGESGTTMWRFDEQPARWQVTLAPDAVAISSTTYTSRTDLLGRLRVVLEAAQRELNLRFCERLGVRYVDQVTEPEMLKRLPALVKPEVMGAAGVATLGGVSQVHFFCDARYRLPDQSELHARWGLLPEHATFDPSVPATPTPSWVLDLDAYTSSQESFEPQTLTGRAQALCERVYRYFRWAVDDAFLQAHGGQP